MSRYILIHRLRIPAVLLLIGVLALLYQTGVIPYFWRLFWPLLLILVGVLLLVERVALAAEGYPLFPGWPWHEAGQGVPSSEPAWRGGWQDTSQAAQQSGTQAPGNAITHSEPHDSGEDANGGQS